MKIKRSGFFKEFKKFITRGSVLDLAVGMIIGAAFTAIVTALVDGIFKPLINAIPMGDGLSGLITMLVPKYDEAGAIDMAASVYINWGNFIMAIINFLLTAFILFLIIRIINRVREGMNEINKDLMLDKAAIAELKDKGMSRREIRKYIEAQEAEKAAKAAAEAEANKPETAEELLKEIRELLRAIAPAKAEETAEKEAE